jgi:hypothetical protein
MCTFCEQDARVIGEFFGYHQCCIDDYLKGEEEHGRGDLDRLTHFQLKYQRITKGRTSFMPCPTHAKQIVKNKLPLKTLVSNRICSVDFPMNSDDTDKVLKEFDEWLAQVK